MPTNNEKKGRNLNRGPTFSVQDELKRDRQLRRTRRVKRARRAERKLLTLFLCTIIFVLAVSAILLLVMRVNTITVEGNLRYSAERIIKSSDADGAILPFVGEDKVEAKIISSCPYIDEVKITKKYPSTLVITVTEAQAKYCTKVNGEIFSLDANLRVIDRVEDYGEYILLKLPDVKTAVEGKTLQFYDETYNELAFTLISELTDGEILLPFTKIDITDRFNIFAFVGESVMIEFGDYRNIGVKLKCADIILDSPDVAMSKRTHIDVSYPDKAVVSPDYTGEFEK